MKLPYMENAEIRDEKITRYLLNHDHPRGKSKAEFFKRFGFFIEQWEILRDALFDHVQRYDVTSTLKTSEGIHYAIEGELSSPDQRNPAVRTIWAIDTDSDIPRFITAYPLK